MKRERERERERERVITLLYGKICIKWEREYQIYSKRMKIRRTKINK